jgi:hypothetical protein
MQEAKKISTNMTEFYSNQPTCPSDYHIMNGFIEFENPENTEEIEGLADEPCKTLKTVNH